MSNTLAKNEQRHILIVTGDISADPYAASLAKACRKISPSLVISGMGGERMKEAGVKLVVDSTPLSVVGFVEVLGKWKVLKEAFQRLREFIKINKPDIVILLDFPGFNLRLAKFIKKENIPILYYIPPQVWAWGRNRVKKIARLMNLVAVIFPFEKEIYEKEGVRTEYVGHPLFELLKREKKRGIRKRPIIGLFPGSRENEVKKILPIMLKSAKLIRKEKKVDFLLAHAKGVKKKTIEALTSRVSVPVKILSGSSLEIIKSADLLLIASGTATLEAAYFQTPMIIIYKVNFFTYLLAKILIKVPWIGLVNLVAGKKIVEEFIQYRAKPKKIASLANTLLTNKEKISEMRKELGKISEKFNNLKTSEKVAKLTFQIMQKSIDKGVKNVC